MNTPATGSYRKVGNGTAHAMEGLESALVQATGGNMT